MCIRDRLTPVHLIECQLTSVHWMSVNWRLYSDCLSVNVCTLNVCQLTSVRWVFVSWHLIECLSVDVCTSHWVSVSRHPYIPLIVSWHPYIPPIWHPYIPLIVSWHPYIPLIVCQLTSVHLDHWVRVSWRQDIAPSVCRSHQNTHHQTKTQLWWPESSPGRRVWKQRRFVTQTH